MTIGAGEVAILVYRLQLIGDLEMAWRFVVAFAARCYRDVRLQAAQCRGLRNIDMTGRALHNVVLVWTTPFMTKLHRDALY
jgi:hypothetical protein